MKNKKILITGAGGFVGSWLVKHLIEQENEVFGLVRRKSDGLKPKNLVDRGILSKVKLIEADLTDVSSLARALDESQPDYIFHLGAQSFVPRSFTHPLETFGINSMGTANLLEAVRIKEYDPVIVFAGSSEEYGLVICSDSQYERVKTRYGAIFPEPEQIPELPINERNPLRPMSPYAVSKVHDDFMVRNYFYSYGMKTIVSRGFNHEGAGRGIMFVTSAITNQVMKLKFGETDKIQVGNINAFRDWSHVNDIIKGYCLIAEKGSYGEVYNQGSMRTNSVLSYILLSLENAGWDVERIESMDNDKTVKSPTEKDDSEIFGMEFEKTKVDRMLLKDELSFDISDKGIRVFTNKGKIQIEFDPKIFRPAEVPILLSDTAKIQKLGFKVEHTVEDIIQDQLNHYIKKENREVC